MRNKKLLKARASNRKDFRKEYGGQMMAPINPIAEAEPATHKMITAHSCQENCTR